MQYASNRSTNPMLKAFDQWGLFLWYFPNCVLLLIFVTFFLPETAGYSLEEMDALFELRWWEIGLASRKPFHRAHSVPRYSIELAANNWEEHDGSGVGVGMQGHGHTGGQGRGSEDEFGSVGSPVSLKGGGMYGSVKEGTTRRVGAHDLLAGGPQEGLYRKH